MTDLSPFAQQFREAMAHLPSAVCVITSNGIAGTIGITVSSVVAVTDNPPTVLFCINQNSGIHDIIKANSKICINVLSPDHIDLAKHFAGMLDSTMEERFNWEIWEESENQQLKLNEAISTLEGEIINIHSVGTHSIFLAELSDISISPQSALLYFGRQFKILSL